MGVRNKPDAVRKPCGIGDFPSHSSLRDLIGRRNGFCNARFNVLDVHALLVHISQVLAVWREGTSLYRIIHRIDGELTKRDLREDLSGRLLVSDKPEGRARDA